MPRQADQPDQPNTLPLPELNPLLNPLLGENMGRWAEVYFRNPPENRERAVLELIQQLETENSARKDVAQAPALEPAPAPQDRTNFQETRSQTIRCDSCGHENPDDQRFCGMCGAPFRNDAAGVQSLAIDNPPSANEFVRREEIAVEPLVREDELSHAQDAGQYQQRDNNTVSSFGNEDRPRSYRVYIGTALAAVILALGYLAWRSEQASDGSPVAVQSPARKTEQRATRGSTPVTAKVEAPISNAPEKVAATPRNEVGAKTEEINTDDNRNMSPAALVAKEPSAPKPQPPAAPGNGSEELAMAQSYLNGTAGHERDDAQAADWLWKAVAKRNAAATLLLSDLYLRGSGVTKNCDQARVLLDAAASRGIRDAAVRLQNMQAFGCQ